MKPALAIFVKTPGLSPVKTRLASTLGPPVAERFHVLAAAAVAAVARDAGQAVDAYWAIAEDDPRARRYWNGLPGLAQGPGGLGRRMHQVYADLRRRHGAALLIGADIPHVRAGQLEAAVRALADHDYVLAPALDGGFWLIGGTRPLPLAAWDGVPYASSETGARMQAVLAARGRLALLESLQDADESRDLPGLHAALARLPHPLAAQRRLRRWLRCLGAHHAPAVPYASPYMESST